MRYTRRYNAHVPAGVFVTFPLFVFDSIDLPPSVFRNFSSRLNSRVSDMLDGLVQISTSVFPTEILYNFLTLLLLYELTCNLSTTCPGLFIIL